MKDFNRLTTRLRQFGGWRLLWQYARMGVLWTGIKEFFKCLYNGRSVKSIYPIITQKIDRQLLATIKTPETYAITPKPEPTSSKQKIWFCWLQGFDHAPELVKACCMSLRRNLPDAVVVIIDNNNYKQYVTLPEYIIKKYDKGIIPHPMFSDLLRLELLLKHGGTWIDASVLCTSNLHWQAIQASELFVFRYFRNGKVVGMANWFIHAKAGNPLLHMVRDMLHAYWHEYNCVVEYYIFHLFFSEAAKRYPEFMHSMPRGNAFANIQLGNRLAMDYDDAWWKQHTSQVSFHKLNYRKADEASLNPHSFYNHIINT